MARLPRTERSRRTRGHRRSILPLFLLLGAGISTVEISAYTATPALEIEFERHGTQVVARNLDWLRETVEPRVVRVHEPYEEKVVAFRALRFDEVLDAVYSRAWRDEEELLFTCRDGYQPTLPVKRVLSHRAWLAFARDDQPGFSIRKLESGAVQTIELGPYYLIWENLDDSQVRQESDFGWPYQLVGIDLIRRRDRFPKLAPPRGSTPEVLAGFEAFRVHCSKCHKLNGEGGNIGPELNPAGGGSGDYYDRAWLRTWIAEPHKIRPNTRMPPLNPALPNRARTVDEIIVYLYAMAGVSDAAATE